MTAGLLESPFGMRWTTLGMAAAFLTVVGVGKRRPVVAVAAMLAWAGGFELTFRLLDIVRWHEWWGFRDLAWEVAALAGWMVAAHALGVRPSLPWIAVTLVAFAIWFAAGFDYNLPQTAGGQHQAIRWRPELENVVAKTGWGMAYLAGALRLERRAQVGILRSLTGSWAASDRRPAS